MFRKFKMYKKKIAHDFSTNVALHVSWIERAEPFEYCSQLRYDLRITGATQYHAQCKNSACKELAVCNSYNIIALRPTLIS